jgi:hypothetical protein
MQPAGTVVHPRTRRISLAAMVITFVLSRAILYLVGVRFDNHGLDWYYQYLEPELLRVDLLRSLYYLHMQPPLFNLFLGIILKAFPAHATLAFAVSYHLLGLVLMISLYLLMLRLGVRNDVNLGLTILFTISPSTILYENYLFYTYPVAALLCLSVLFLHRYLTTDRLRDALFFFTLLAMIALIRSLFHFVWFVAAVLLLFWAAGNLRRKTLTAAAIPFLTVAGWHLKNLIIFGSFAASTWLGMNLAKSVIWKVDQEERRALIDRGILSPLADIRPFNPLDQYAPFIFPILPTDIPALDRELKASGEPNFNNIRYIEISEQYKKDALVMLKHNPISRCEAFAHSFNFYFMPASDYFLLDVNRLQITYLERIYDLLVAGQFLNLQPTNDRVAVIPDGLIRKFFSMGLFLLVALPGLFVFGCIRLWRDWPRRRECMASVLVIGFICLNIIYVTLVGNIFELGENMRFRFLINPLFLTLLGLLVSSLLGDWKRERR